MFRQTKTRKPKTKKPGRECFEEKTKQWVTHGFCQYSQWKLLVISGKGGFWRNRGKPGGDRDQENHVSSNLLMGPTKWLLDKIIQSKLVNLAVCRLVNNVSYQRINSIQTHFLLSLSPVKACHTKHGPRILSRYLELSHCIEMVSSSVSECHPDP